MKKTLRILALAMVTVILTLALVSCGGPNADPDKAVEALKKNGIVLAGKDTKLLPPTFEALGADGIDCVVSGTGKIDDEFATITIIYFDEAADAKDAMEKIEDYAEKNKDDEAKDSEWVFKQSGKMIWFGTKAAIKAAK